VAYHPGPGKWCIKEVVGHLTEEDKRDFVGRIERMFDQAEPQLGLNDQDEVAQQRQDWAKDMRESCPDAFARGVGTDSVLVKRRQKWIQDDRR